MGDLRDIFATPRPTNQEQQAAYNRYLASNMAAAGKPTSRLKQLDQRIANCQTRRKAAIMRAAAATREV